MFWDSDVSDPHLGYVRSRDGIDLYTRNLIDVVSKIKDDKSIKYFAIAGPEVLGELKCNYFHHHHHRYHHYPLH